MYNLEYLPIAIDKVRPIKFWPLLVQWRRNSITRRHLRNIEEYRLADIGIEKTSADREACKPFWQS